MSRIRKNSLGVFKADAFVGIDVFGASAPGGTCGLDQKKLNLYDLVQFRVLRILGG